MVSGNQSLEELVNHQLSWDASLRGSAISVSIDDAGRVTLTGTVPSYVARQAAESDALIVRGVVSVDNQLSVVYHPSLPVPSDDELRARILSLFQWNVDIYGNAVNVNVRGGEVVIEGTVDAYWKKVKAEELASQIAGTRDIHNHIQVKPSVTAADESVLRDIKQAINRTMGLDPDQIKIKVRQGIVFLSGTVPTWPIYFALEDTARYTSGVVNVENNLAIE